MHLKKIGSIKKSFSVVEQVDREAGFLREERTKCIKVFVASIIGTFVFMFVFVFFFVIFFFFIFVFFFFSLVERRTKCIKVFVTIINGTFSKAHIMTFQKRNALFSNCRPTSLAVENPKLPSGKQEDLVSKNLPKAKKAQNSF